MTGRDIVYESIRQKCIYKTGTKYYFRYMRSFYEECFESMTEKCSINLMKSKSIDYTSVLKCVSGSFNTLSED